MDRKLILMGILWGVILSIVITGVMLGSAFSASSAQAASHPLPLRVEGTSALPSSSPETPFAPFVEGDKDSRKSSTNSVAAQVAAAPGPLMVSEIGRLEMAVLPEDVWVRDHLAFIADEDVGLRVLDVTDPMNPVEIGQGATPGLAVSVVAAGALAFVTDGRIAPNGLRIFNVSDPTNPLLVGSLDTTDEARDVVVDGSLAYVAAGTDGVQIVDIAVPSSPVVLAVADTPGEAYGVAISGNHLFVCDGGFNLPHGLRIFDITNPEFPAQVGNFDMVEEALDVEVSEVHAYVANGSAGFRILDVSDPALPAEVGSFLTPDRAVDVEVSASTAYVADYNSGLLIIDITDPSLPVQVGSLDTGVANNLHVTGSLVFVADGFAGLEIIDVGNPSTPADVGGFPAPGVFSVLAVYGDKAYIADANFGLRSVDVGTLTDPMLLNNHGLPLVQGFGPTAIEVTASRAFVADPFYLQILDVSDPATPIDLGTFAAAGFISDIAVLGNFAYLASGFSLQVIDVSIPASPVVRGTLTLPGSANAVKVVGQTAYIGYGGNITPGFDQSGLLIADVFNSDLPVEIARVDLTGVSQPEGSVDAVKVVGDLLYVLAVGKGLLIFNVLDPTNPSEIGRLDSISIFSLARLAVDRSFAYVITSPENSQGIEIVNVSDPTAPEAMGVFLGDYSFQDIDVVNGTIYLAERTGGLRVATALPVEIEIDIKPRSWRNLINRWGWGFIPVAVLSNGDFDATSEVDRTSLTFGRTGNEDSFVRCLRCGIDVDRNGYEDLFCLFRNGRAGFQCGDEEGFLKGELVDGTLIEGSDPVSIWPCR